MAQKADSDSPITSIEDIVEEIDEPAVALPREGFEDGTCDSCGADLQWPATYVFAKSGGCVFEDYWRAKEEDVWVNRLMPISVVNVCRDCQTEDPEAHLKRILSDIEGSDLIAPYQKVETYRYRSALELGAVAAIVATLAFAWTQYSAGSLLLLAEMCVAGFVAGTAYVRYRDGTTILERRENKE